MTGWDGGLVMELPLAERWDFGGHPYGLEPLTLPVDPYAAPAGPILDLSSAGPTAGLSDLPRPDPVDQLFWFRWITGHQATFVLWQLLAQEVREVPADPAARDAAAARVAKLIRGYSAMLLYTASCPRETYHRVIRPSMALQHPAFSGSWARDYAFVRPLLRGRVPEQWGSAATVITDECAVSSRVHDGVAAKLVPGSPSLLQTAIRHGQNLWRRQVLEVLYDTYFLTLRAPLPVATVLVQLVRRARAIERDVAANGLYPPFAPSLAEKPWSLHSSDVDTVEQAVQTILSEVVGDAIERSAP